VNLPVSIGIAFPGRRFTDAQSLVDLSGHALLDGDMAYPTVIFNGAESPIECPTGFQSEGNFYIHHLYEATSEATGRKKLVVAGTFGFRLESACGSYLVEQGRFDFDDFVFLDEPW
jgi:hypothetical protein